MLNTQVVAAKQAFLAQTSVMSTSTGGHVEHRVYGLIECPELEDCTFVLIDRTAAPAVEVLLVGELEEDAPSLNRATLRRLGANLGVRLIDIDVHVFLGATSRQVAAKAFSTTTRSRRSAGVAYLQQARLAA